MKSLCDSWEKKGELSYPIDKISSGIKMLRGFAHWSRVFYSGLFVRHLRVAPCVANLVMGVESEVMLNISRRIVLK